VVDAQCIAHAIACGVVAAGEQRLRVVVDAHRGRCAQLERGQCEDAAAAAKVQHRLALQVAVGGQRVEPAQAQRRGRVGAGAESQAGIQPHHGGIAALRVGGQLVVPGHDPGARAKAQWRVLVHPRALPVLVLDSAERRLRPVEPGIEGFQHGQQRQRIGGMREQCRQAQCRPQRRLADAGFKDRALVGGVGLGIEQGHRQRADLLQRALGARLFSLAAGQGKFEVGHVRSLSYTSDNDRSLRSASRFSR
jgi:hypothetical protein